MAVPMRCKVCGEQTFITVKISAVYIPLCQKHYMDHSIKQTEKDISKLLADLRAGKPIKCSPKMKDLAKKAVERKKKK